MDKYKENLINELIEITGEELEYIDETSFKIIEEAKGKNIRPYVVTHVAAAILAQIEMCTQRGPTNPELRMQLVNTLVDVYLDVHKKYDSAGRDSES